MNFITAIILGIVEGATEFLPISSTAHLILAAKILNLSQTEYLKFFEVFIQGGAILAVVMAFFKEFIKPKLYSKIIASFIPTGIIGFLLYKVIKNLFMESTPIIAASLILVSLVFLIVEYLLKTKKIKLTKKISQLNYRDAVILGLAQSLAVIPGVSRAGVVLITGLFLGYERKEAALYSFVLAVPTILAASGYDLLKTNPQIISQNLNFTLISFLAAFVSAFFVVRWLIKYLQNKNLVPFAIYRIILGLIVVTTIIYA